jgi:hypothetical protein
MCQTLYNSKGPGLHLQIGALIGFSFQITTAVPLVATMSSNQSFLHSMTLCLTGTSALVFALRGVEGVA